MVTINGISDALKGTNSPLQLDGVNLNNINIQYLLDASKEERKSELSILPQAYQMIEDLGLNQSKTSGLLEGKDVRPLLTLLHDSYLFNSFESEDKNTDKNRTDLTVFEQMVQYMFVETGVLSYVTEAKTEEEQKIEFKDIILSIGNDLNGKNPHLLEEQDGWTGFHGENEIQRVQDMVDNLSGIEDLEAEMLYKLTKTQLTNLICAMNHSRLAHKAVYKFYETTLKEIGFTSFLNRPDLINYRLSGYDGDVLSKHDDEIALFIDLIDAAKVGKDENENAIYFSFGTSDIKEFIETVGEDGK